MKKKRNNLDNKKHLKRRQEALDFDYLHKLDDKEREWLDKFVSEYIGASLPKEVVVRDGKEYARLKPTNIHKKKHKKKVFDANNARNRDLYAIKRCTNGLNYLDNKQLWNLQDSEQYSEVNSFEDNIIASDLYEKNFELYKIELQDYMDSLPCKTATEKKKRTEELEYYHSLGYDWLT